MEYTAADGHVKGRGGLLKVLYVAVKSMEGIGVVRYYVKVYTFLGVVLFSVPRDCVNSLRV